MLKITEHVFRRKNLCILFVATHKVIITMFVCVGTNVSHVTTADGYDYALVDKVLDVDNDESHLAENSRYVLLSAIVLHVLEQ